MKILIAYTTKSGTTFDLANMLGKHFSAHEVVYADLASEKPYIPDFDAIMIGSPIRMRRISKAVKVWIDENMAEIVKKPFGIFLCCGFPDNAEDYLTSNFTSELLGSAASALSFGGETRLSRQKGLDKLVMKFVLHHIASNNRNEDRERDIPYPAILPENIRRFSDEMKRSFQKT